MIKKITNEQLLKDIDITQRESYAYRSISEGFERLMLLHEKDGMTYSKLCRIEHLKYHEKYKECLHLLEALLKIKENRGLQ